MKCAYKNTPDNAENLEMLNVVLRDVYFENSRGSRPLPPTPTPPLDPRQNPSNPNFFDILYTGTALYGQIVNTI